MDGPDHGGLFCAFPVGSHTARCFSALGAGMPVVRKIKKVPGRIATVVLDGVHMRVSVAAKLCGVCIDTIARRRKTYGSIMTTEQVAKHKHAKKDREAKHRMKNDSPMIKRHGRITTFSEMSSESGVSVQTLYDRWKRLGRPQDIPDSMLGPPATKGWTRIKITFDGQIIAISALAALIGQSRSSIYRKIAVHGAALKTEHFQPQQQGKAKEDAEDKPSAPWSPVAQRQPVHDPNDRSPGWCERKYDFLRNSGVRKSDAASS